MVLDRLKAAGQALITVPTPAASGDTALIQSWLHNRPAATVRTYTQAIQAFLDVVDKPLGAVKLVDLQAFADGLASLAPATQAKYLSAIKSLFSFGQKTGYLQFNVGAALRLPKVPDDLAERILPEEAVQRMLAKTEDSRDHALIRLLYGAGLRRAEIAGAWELLDGPDGQYKAWLGGLRWRSLAPGKDGAGFITVLGKGGRTRTVKVSPQTFQHLLDIQPAGALPDDAVFTSQIHGPDGKRLPLSASQIYRTVRTAADRAKVGLPVSPHWLRHAHASHALDRGAPLPLVRDTLGHRGNTTLRYLHARPEQSSSEFLPV